MMDRGLEPIALSGYLSGAPRLIAARAGSFQLDEREAAAIAVSDRTGGEMTRAELLTSGKQQGPYGFIDQDMQNKRAGAPTLTEPVRYKKVYFRTADAYEPAYYLEVIAEIRGRGRRRRQRRLRLRRLGDRRADPLAAQPDRFGQLHLSALGRYVGQQRELPSGQPARRRNDTASHRHVSWSSATAVHRVLAPHAVVASVLGRHGRLAAARRPRRPTATTSTPTPTSRPGRLPAGRRLPRHAPTAPGTFDRTYDTTRRRRCASADAAQGRGHSSSSTSTTSCTTGSTTAGLRRGRGQRADRQLRPRRPRRRQHPRRGPGLQRPEQRQHEHAGGRRPAPHADVRLQRPAAAEPDDHRERPAALAGNADPSAPRPGFGRPDLRRNSRRRRGRTTASGGEAQSRRREARSTNAAALAGKIALIDRGGAVRRRLLRSRLSTRQPTGAVGVIIANIATSANPDDRSGHGLAPTRPCPPSAALSFDIAVMSTASSNGQAWRSTLAHGTVNARMSRAFTPSARRHHRQPDRGARVGPLHQQPPHRQRHGL